MEHEENLSPQGVCTATLVCRDKLGNKVPLKDAISDETLEIIESKNLKPPKDSITQGNLVVNSGRSVLAKMLGGNWVTQNLDTPYINRITLGDGEKSGNLPNLSDTGLVSEITKTDGTVAGTFLLEDPHEVSPDITFPSETAKFPGAGTYGGSAEVTINASGETILEDTSVDFINTIGAQLTDQVTLDNSVTNPSVLGIKEVRSTTELVLHNPTGITASAGTQYSVQTPGTQMLVSKLIEGNSFAKSEYGAAVIVHEAGLLFNTDQLFNRVVYAPQSEEIGVLIQSDETNGVEISVRFEWLVTL